MDSQIYGFSIHLVLSRKLRGDTFPATRCSLLKLFFFASCPKLAGRSSKVPVRRIWAGRGALPVLLVSLFPGSAFAASFSASTSGVRTDAAFSLCTPSSTAPPSRARPRASPPHRLQRQYTYTAPLCLRGAGHASHRQYLEASLSLHMAASAGSIAPFTTIADFMSSSRAGAEAVLATGSSDTREVVICLGNEAADLDSICSAVVLALGCRLGVLNRYLPEEKKFSSDFIAIPALSIPADDFAL